MYAPVQSHHDNAGWNNVRASIRLIWLVRVPHRQEQRKSLMQIIKSIKMPPMLPCATGISMTKGNEK